MAKRSLYSTSSKKRLRPRLGFFRLRGFSLIFGFIPALKIHLRLALLSKPTSRLSTRSEEHTSELQSQSNLVCRLLLEKKQYPNDLIAPRDEAPTCESVQVTTRHQSHAASVGDCGPS